MAASRTRVIFASSTLALTLLVGCGGATGTISFCGSDEDCAEGQVCNTANGQCVDRCTDTSCPVGEICNDDTGLCEEQNSCVDDPSICGSGEICDPITGECVDDCSVTGCETGFVCDTDSGLCLPEDDCRIAGCETDEVCDTGTGECIDDCRTVDDVCDSDEVCDDDTGLCVEAGCTVTGCPDGEVCDPATDECVDDCNVAGCEGDLVCDAESGLCVSSDDCRVAGCDEDFVCDAVTGECVDDCRIVGCTGTDVCDDDTGLCRDFDCALDGCEGTDVCDSTTGECRGFDCVLDGCGIDEVCDTLLGVCVDDCRTVADVCDVDDVCDDTTGFCRDFDCTLDGCEGTDVCDSTTGACRPFDCNVDGCTGTDVCETVTGVCRPFDCNVDGCTGTDVCETTTGDCRPFDCNVDGCTGTDVCETTTGDCRPFDCTLDGCTGTDVCDSTSGLCRPFDCTVDGCPGTLTCSTITGNCVDCDLCDTHETCDLALETCSSLDCGSAIDTGLTEGTPVDMPGLSVAPDGGEDYWAFDVASGRSCTATIDVGFIHADGNIDIELWNADCSTQLDLAASTDDDEQIIIDLPPGTYVIYVYGMDGAATTYDLGIALSGCVDFNPPIVVITNPPDGYTTTERFLGNHSGALPNDFLEGTVTVTGGLTMPATVDISTNGFVQTAAVVSGAFQAAVVLHEGANTIIVSATNEGGTGQDTIGVTSTVLSSQMLVTLIWDGTADLDLYITEPTTETAWYGAQTTSTGGYLDVDNTTAYGPENFSHPAGTTPPTGVYEINAHYYSGTAPEDWELVVVLNEGTADETRQTYSGTLSSWNSASAGPDDIRSDDAWAGYDVSITSFPNPFDGSTAYGYPIVRIEHDPSAMVPFFVIPTP